MPTTTTYMGLTKPLLNLEPGTWDTSLNLSLDTIDLHNHVTGNGVPIPTAGILLNADLTFGGYAALNLKALAFTAQTSYTVARSLFVLSADNELYWRNNSGVNVKLTSGTGLNIAAVGGLTGDYGSSGASFYYDDATETYLALQTAPLPNVWAALASGNLDLYEKASGITNRIRLSSPASLAASYALTFPAALPASTSILQLSAAGAISASTAIAITAASLRASSTSTYTSLLKGLDPSSGNIRAVIDHNGYRMGRVSEWVEDWRTSSSTDPTGWLFSSTAQGETRTYTAPSSAMPFRTAVLALPAVSTCFAIVAGPGIAYVGADLLLVYETIVRTGAAVDSGVAMDMAVGLQSAGDSAEFRFSPDVNANVLTSIGTLGSNAVVTSVAVAVSTTYQLRIEVVGDNNHAGSNTLFRFFINGTLVDERTAATVTGALAPWFFIKNGAGSSAYTATCGPIRCVWNQVAAPADL